MIQYKVVFTASLLRFIIAKNTVQDQQRNDNSKEVTYRLPQNSFFSARVMQDVLFPLAVTLRESQEMPQPKEV